MTQEVDAQTESTTEADITEDTNAQEALSNEVSCLCSKRTLSLSNMLFESAFSSFSILVIASLAIFLVFSSSVVI